MKDVFKKIIKEFHEATLPEVIHREYILNDVEEITALIGLRRVGKTYLLFQKIQELSKQGVTRQEIVFINFEDERLVGLKTEQLDLLLEAYYELNPEFVDGQVYLLFDEIQTAPNWNLFLKRLYEKKQYKIFITGSSSKLLSTELATELRGRTKTVQVFPLSFLEYLSFKGVSVEKDISFSKKRFEVMKYFDEFLEYGGYPVVAKYSNKIEKDSTLKNYVQLIIYKDIVERFKIRNTLALKNLMKYLVTNISTKLSLNAFYESVKKEGNISKDAVWEYFSHLEDIHFASLVPRYFPSLKKQMDSPKKLYIADNGFKTVYGFNVSEDLGKLLENLAFIELQRRGREVYFHEEKGECDFIIKNKNQICEAIQVCYSITDENRAREYNGLLEAMQKFKLEQGIILTNDQEDELVRDKKKILIRPVWKWLLNA